VAGPDDPALDRHRRRPGGGDGPAGPHGHPRGPRRGLHPAAVVDEVFALDGFGQAFLVAVKAGDLLVIMAVTVATVIGVALVNLGADVCYALLDPRIKIA
jgi:hypothetical protein